MSCSPVRIRGASNVTQYPQGPPMLIANLKANPYGPEGQDRIWSRCNTAESLWIRYPERNKGVNPPIVASSPPNDSPIKFSNFDDPDGYCGSDNRELVEALALGSSLPVAQTPLVSKSTPSSMTSQITHQTGQSRSTSTSPSCSHHGSHSPALSSAV